MYDNPKLVTYLFAGVDFSSGDATKIIPVPRGATQASIMDISVVAETTFTQTTTPALVQVGDGTTANKFAELNVGATASGSSISSRDAAVRKAEYISADYDSALHDLTLSLIAPTGGTPAGKGDVRVVVAYNQIEV